MYLLVENTIKSDLNVFFLIIILINFSAAMKWRQT